MLALLADARLPTGAHTQSAGLEPALRAGLPPAAVPGYIAARLRTVTVVEAATAVVARHVAATSGSAVTGADLDAVEAAWAARTPSAALRASSRQLGRGYLRLLRRLWPDQERIPRSWRPSRPVALGVLAARAGLDAEHTARLVGYDDAQTIAAATLKLEPVDPAVATGWVLSAQSLIEELVTAVSGLTAPQQIPACAAPLVEQWAEDHARTTERLFSA
ncbi:urease accessory protein UreF [Rhodococcus zopfii]|uniref:Urease accessory protein UreF n=1 Tax=Rhodococcus zopfii TaxID=43772 RepID=A0ABU3WN89_9NOCA|nr:urease accessory protein UreF [Rhodococcus zopfii]